MLKMREKEFTNLKKKLDLTGEIFNK